MSTQRERAEQEIMNLADLLDFNEPVDCRIRQISKDLRFVLGEAQNSPPDGLSDGSISGDHWMRLQNVSQSIDRLIADLERLAVEEGI